jgi:hypothetical protein
MRAFLLMPWRWSTSVKAVFVERKQHGGVFSDVTPSGEML